MITSNLTCIWFIVRCIMWQLSHFCNLKMLLFFLCLRVSQPCIKSAHVSYFLDWKLFYKLHWNLFFLCIPSLQSLSPNSSVCLQWISSSEAAWRCVMANVFQPVSFGCILSPCVPPPLLHLIGMHFICITPQNFITLVVIKCYCSSSTGQIEPNMAAF